MTDRDPRNELAAIARSARRLLEREDAQGLAELLARDARPRTSAAVAPPLATPADRSAPSADRAEATSSRATPTPAPSAPRAPAARSVDLFGNPIAVAAPADDVDAMDIPTMPLPSVHLDLNPAGWEERAVLAEAALPILEEIAGEVRGCVQCGLCDTRTNAVPGVGTARSGIVFVGEAPGADEDAQGEPFVGRAGQLLTRIIKAMDDAKLIPGVTLDRSTVYICNVLKCRPPENRNPLPNEIETCSPYLRRQLAALKPRIICCLGKFAAELLVGVKGTIGGLRGRVYPYQGAKLIVTYHPAACLRNPNYKRPVWEDMQLLAREYAAD
jgi:DNA polymerase